MVVVVVILVLVVVVADSVDKFYSTLYVYKIAKNMVLASQKIVSSVLLDDDRL